MSKNPVIAVLGVGPGLGAAVARRFARGGFAVGLMARKDEHLRPVHDELKKSGSACASILADAGDAPSVTQAFSALREQLGPADVLVYNAGAFNMGGILELTPEVFESAWRANCMGAFLASQQCVPSMLERGRGTVIFTGATASLRGGARFAGLAVGKFGLRALAQSMARELGPRGIHVAHVVIDGMIDTPRVRSMVPDRAPETMLSPEAIAETYWQLHSQEPSVWTHELDVRPSVEKF